MKKTIKAIFILTAICLIISTFSCNTTKIEDIRDCVIIEQYCGFDGLDDGYYQVRSLKTGIVSRIDVDIRDCSVYNVGDTIH